MYILLYDYCNNMYVILVFFFGFCGDCILKFDIKI